MRQRSIARVVLSLTLSVCASHTATAQQKPLTRTFIAGTEERYQVTGTIRVETHGISTKKEGDKAYASFYTHVAEGQVNWRATRQIVSVLPDASGVIAEYLDRFQASCDGVPSSESFDGALQKSVQDTCADWRTLVQMRYEEEKLGVIRGTFTPVIQVSGADSPLLPLWIRRAFRPSAILPKTPIQFGVRSTQKIRSDSEGESDLKGEETTEWLVSSEEIPTATLHVSQDLRWVDPSPKSASTGFGSKPPMRQYFYADSLNTISLLDGSLVKASRSATRESKELFDALPDFINPPDFGSKLTITVTILRLP